jgi:hypothetical protein
MTVLVKANSNLTDRPIDRFLDVLVESYSCEKWEAGSWGQVEFGNPEEKERAPLKAAAKQRLLQTEKTSCVMQLVIFGVCDSVRLS